MQLRADLKKAKLHYMQSFRPVVASLECKPGPARPTTDPLVSAALAPKFPAAKRGVTDCVYGPGGRGAIGN